MCSRSEGSEPLHVPIQGSRDVAGDDELVAYAEALPSRGRQRACERRHVFTGRECCSSWSDKLIRVLEYIL